MWFAVESGVHVRYSLVGQDTRLSPEQRGLQSRLRNISLNPQWELESTPLDHSASRPCSSGNPYFFSVGEAAFLHFLARKHQISSDLCGLVSTVVG